MMKGSKSSGNSVSKRVATIGYSSAVPVKTTVTFRGGKGVGSIETKSRVRYGEKQSGCCGRETTKEKASLTIKKESKNSGNSAIETLATIGYTSAVPVRTAVTFKGGKGVGVGSFQTKSGVRYVDKQSGCYGGVTTKEKASAGEFKWKNGTSGTKSEYKKSSTVRVGNKSGYTEVYNEQRVRSVSCNKSSGSKNRITYY